MGGLAFILFVVFIGCHSLQVQALTVQLEAGKGWCGFDAGRRVSESPLHLLLPFRPSEGYGEYYNRIYLGGHALCTRANPSVRLSKEGP